MEPVANNFIRNEILKQERNLFLGKIFSFVVIYSIVTLWLNSIRTTAPIWFVWLLIIIQFLFYFSIFIVSYRYSKVIGLNEILAFILFIILAVLGRVNDWEIIIIPLLLITMLILALKNKKLSEKGNTLLSEIQNNNTKTA